MLCCKSDFFDLVTFKYLYNNNYSWCDNIQRGITSLLGKCFTLKVLSSTRYTVCRVNTYRTIICGIQTPRLAVDCSKMLCSYILADFPSCLVFWLISSVIATADVTSRLIDFVTETLLLVPSSPWFFWFSVVLLVLLILVVLRGSSGSPWFFWFFCFSWFLLVLVVLRGSSGSCGSQWFSWFSGYCGSSGSGGWLSCCTSCQISSD